MIHSNLPGKVIFAIACCIVALICATNALAHSIIPSDGTRTLAVASEQNDGLKEDRYVIYFHPIYADQLLIPRYLERNSTYADELFVPQYAERNSTNRIRGHIELLSITMSLKQNSDNYALERFDAINVELFNPDGGIGGFIPGTNSIKLVMGHLRRETSKGTLIDAARLDIGEGFCVGFGKTALAYMLLEADLQASDDLTRGFAVGPAVSFGLIVNPFPVVGIGLYVRGVEYVYGEKERDVDMTLTSQLWISKHITAQADLKRVMLDEKEIRSISLMIKLSYDMY